MEFFKQEYWSGFLFHPPVDHDQDINGKDLTEGIKKSCQEYTELLYKKNVLMSWITIMVWSLK